MLFMASPAGGRITPLPSNEFYQSPFDGRWVDVDEAEVFRLIDMQRERIFGTHEKDAIATPAETSTQAVCDVLADHLGDLDMEFGFHVSYTDRGRVRCDCGGEYNDLHAWRVHLAETLFKALGKDESCCILKNS